MFINSFSAEVQNVNVSEVGIDGVSGADNLTGQTKIGANLARRAIEKITTTDIREIGRYSLLASPSWYAR